MGTPALGPVAGGASRAGALALLVQAGALGVLAAVCGLLTWSVVPVAAGWTPHVVLSGSMEPNLRTGDVVVTAPLPADRLRSGLVVLFADPHRPGRTLLHRVSERRGDELVTRGDANAVPDPVPVSVQEVDGVARLRVPGVGLPVAWLRGAPVTAPAAAAVGLVALAAVVVLPGRRRVRPVHRDSPPWPPRGEQNGSHAGGRAVAQQSDSPGNDAGPG
ncbi:signal peptidase I [Kineococcus sp. SYSU DK004]|uniref:signal peptidase I n=1 Tax=Kineococcus sp. SYSU DK004 TaxID=3383125 RepID=UPI003D7E907D